MCEIPMRIEKWKALPVILNISLVTAFLIIGWKSIDHQRVLSCSGTGGEQLKKIFFILLLIYHLSQVTACNRGEYEHDNTCCSLCAAGSVVAKHCTVVTGTVCSPCTAGEYIEHPNGLEKCFNCKTCDRDLGLQMKEECTYTRNTKCEPRKGYYCIENCQMVNKHTTCPPGHGVKEKGTPLKDTVCEQCPEGTFSDSDSSTEACKNWTVCEKLNLQLVEPGSSEADVTCAENNNLKVIIAVIVIAVIDLILVLAIVFWRYPGLRPCFTKRPKNRIVKGDRLSPAGNNINENPSHSTPMYPGGNEIS